MKVLFLTSMYLKPGRAYAGAAIHRQAIELSRAGVEVRVICPLPRFRLRKGRTDPYAELLKLGTTRIDGISITYLPFINIPLSLSTSLYTGLLRHRVARVCDEVWEETPFDLIHAHRLFPTARVGLSLAERYGVPLVSSAVGSDVHTHPRGNAGIRRGTEEVIRRSAAVVAVSRGLAEDITALESRGVSPVVVYRGVDHRMFMAAPPSPELRVRLGHPSDGIGICSVGRLARTKGVFELLAAFGELASRQKDLWLAFVGEGPAGPELETEIDRMGLKGRVLMAGSRPHEEIPEWLNACDFFVLASHGEGLPNVVREAMACQRAVVATDVGGVGEAVADGESGFLVPPHDPVALAKAMERLVQSPDLRKRMGEAGRTRVMEHFDWTATTSELVRIYQSVLWAAHSASAVAP